MNADGITGLAAFGLFILAVGIAHIVFARPISKVLRFFEIPWLPPFQTEEQVRRQGYILTFVVVAFTASVTAAPLIAHIFVRGE